MQVEMAFKGKSVAVMHAERLHLMSNLLAEQEALLLLATDDVVRCNDQDQAAAADVAQQASSVVVMLRHHLARLGENIPKDRERASDRASAMREAISRKIRRRSTHQLFNILQRRLATRLRRELVSETM